VAKDAIVSKELAEKFKTEKDTPYLRFVRGDGLDIISAQYVPNLCTVELKPWPRRGDGAKGVFINHEASRTSNDCYVCEIAPGKKLEPRHHLFEEMIMVLSGRGSTTVWNNSGARVTFEWKAGSIFAIPLNCWYQHFNGSGQEVVRLVAVTNFPSVMNLYEDVDFVFNFDLTADVRVEHGPHSFSDNGVSSSTDAVDNFRQDVRVGIRTDAEPKRAEEVGEASIRKVPGALELHVLDEVRQAELVIVFEHRPRLHDQPQLDLLCRFAVGTHVEAQAVGQSSHQHVRIDRHVLRECVGSDRCGGGLAAGESLSLGLGLRRGRREYEGEENRGDAA